MKAFDLNIDTILEDWDASHAIRELISNAIDESVLSGTKPPEVYKNGEGTWCVRDFGRGLRHEDLIQRENPEKLSNPNVIGKFGIGLKDALATFERQGVKILIRSRHGDISLTRISKHAFEDLVTLHAAVSPPSMPDFEGTECCLWGVSGFDVSRSKQMFLRFSGAQKIEETKFGSVYPRAESGGIIYLNGLQVAEEPRFLFSYDITSLNSAIKRALNRERQNLGRVAYADRVRAILVSCESKLVSEALADDLRVFSGGAAHDELSWLDVQQHSARILNSTTPVIFLNPNEIIARPDIVESAVSAGRQIITVSSALTKKIQGTVDVAGQPVTDLRQFVKTENESFQFSWVEPTSLSASELKVWVLTDSILRLIGGRPQTVRDIRISETLRSDAQSYRNTVGLWDSNTGTITIKRSELASVEAFAGTLLHEALHAKYSLNDVSRDFESHLTSLVGQLVARIFNSNSAS